MDRFFRYFFFACLLLLVPGLLLRIPVGGAGILATDVILPTYAGLWLFYKALVIRKVPKAVFVLPAALFSLFAFMTFWYGAYELDMLAKVLSFAYIVRFVSIVIVGWSVVDILKTEEEKDQFWHLLMVLCFIIAVLGFLQFWLVPDISQWSEEGKWDPHTGRLLGTWMDPNFMAGFMGFLLPLTFGRLYTTTQKRRKLFYAVLAAIFAYALFLTFSRSGYLAAATGLGFFFILRDPRVLLIGVIFAGIGIATSQRSQERLTQLVGTFSAILLQETDEVDPTANLRIESWRKSLTLFEKYPLTGIGYNTYRYRAAEEGIVDPNFYSAGGSDSTLLNILITTGVFGFVLFLWFYVTLWVRHLWRYFQTKNSLSLGFSCGLTAMLVHSMFVNSILFPLIFLVIMSVAGVLEKER